MNCDWANIRGEEASILL